MFKLEKSKLPIITIAFWIFLIGSIISIFNIFNLYKYDLNIDSLLKPLSSIKVNVLMNDKKPYKPFVCFDSYCQSLDNNIFNNVFSYTFDETTSNEFTKKSINKVYIAIADKYYNDFNSEINSLAISLDKKMHYFSQSDILKLNKKTFEMQLNDEKKSVVKYSALEIPISNYNGIYNYICILFLSLFYSIKLFFIPIIGLLLANAMYIFKKDEIKFLPKINFSKKYIYYTLSAILLIGTLLRLNDFSTINFWLDELYTKMIAIKDFKSCFQDPGNPPFFYIVEYIFAKISNYNDLIIKIPSLICGILLPLVTYILLNKINYKLGLFGAFFVAINSINIYHSQEIRSSALCMLLVMTSISVLFEYLKNPKKNLLITYTIIAIMMINTHYYLSILLLGNFIWTINEFIKTNKKDNIKGFILSNILIILSFIPYLIVSIKNAINSDFNSWIGAFNFDRVLYLINEFFNNPIIFIVFALIGIFMFATIFIPKKPLAKIGLIKNEKKEKLFKYIFSQLFLLLTITILISYFAKPIFHKRLFLSCYSLLMLFEILSISTIFDFRKLNKIFRFSKITYSILIFYLCTFITHPMNLKPLYSFSQYMDFINQDSKQFIEKGYEIHGFQVDFPQAFEYYDDVKKIDISWHLIEANQNNVLTKFKESDYTKKDKAVFYISNIGADLTTGLLLKGNVYNIEATSPTLISRVVYNKEEK